MLESTAHIPMCYKVTPSTACTALKLGHIPVWLSCLHVHTHHSLKSLARVGGA
ncbi:MAG TPA: hypothetical protein VJ767_03855 [Nitrososphaeraceae archaeon]|nr:hypothetical protein [Nitrososphaeraceae archaeon]